MISDKEIDRIIVEVTGEDLRTCWSGHLKEYRDLLKRGYAEGVEYVVKGIEKAVKDE